MTVLTGDDGQGERVEVEVEAEVITEPIFTVQMQITASLAKTLANLIDREATFGMGESRTQALQLQDGIGKGLKEMLKQVERKT